MLRYLLVLLMLTALIPVSANADKPFSATASGPSPETDQAKFSAAEKHMIRAGLLSGPRQEKPALPASDLPAGLNKQLSRGHSLPPGWQRRVSPGKRLDYQLYRQAEPLPRALLKRLPASPAGTMRIRIGDSILRLEAATRVVLDMFDLHRR